MAFFDYSLTVLHWLGMYWLNSNNDWGFSLIKQLYCI